MDDETYERLLGWTGPEPEPEPSVSEQTKEVVERARGARGKLRKVGASEELTVSLPQLLARNWRSQPADGGAGSAGGSPFRRKRKPLRNEIKPAGAKYRAPSSRAKPRRGNSEPQHMNFYAFGSLVDRNDEQAIKLAAAVHRRGAQRQQRPPQFKPPTSARSASVGGSWTAASSGQRAAADQPFGSWQGEGEDDSDAMLLAAAAHAERANPEAAAAAAGERAKGDSLRVPPPPPPPPPPP
eukprot:SAG22_NODE_3058_length_1976_cov_1.962174_2_plen_239_part_01